MELDLNNLYRHISAYDVLEVRTNKKKLVNFKYGSKLVDDKCGCEAESKIMLYCIRGDVNAAGNKGGQIFLTRNLPLIPNPRALIDISDVKKLTLFVNKSYEFWSNLRGTSSFETPEDILSNLATVQLLSNRLAPVHCACVDYNGTGILIIAPSNTGKTFTTFKLVKEFDFNFVAEDIAISDGKNIFGCPFTATGVPFHPKNNSLRNNRLKEIFFPSQIEKRKLVDCFHESKIVTTTCISHVIFLKAGSSSIHSLPKATAKNWMIRNNMLEFKYITNRDLLALWNQFDYPDLMQLYQTERTLLTKIIDNANEVLYITSPQVEGFAEQIKLLV